MAFSRHCWLRRLSGGRKFSAPRVCERLYRLEFSSRYELELLEERRVSMYAVCMAPALARALVEVVRLHGKFNLFQFPQGPIFAC